MYQFKAEQQQADIMMHLKNRTYKYGLFLGGIGTGKSTTGAHFSYDRITDNPETIGLIGANTYSQLFEATLPAFTEMLDEVGCEYVIGKAPPKTWNVRSRFKRHNRVMSFPNGAQIILRSLERYNSIRGSQFGWFWLDELRDTRKEAWDVIKGRLRHPKSKLLCGLATTSPVGFNWMYEEFHVKPMQVDSKGRRKNFDHGYVKMSTYDNAHNLPEGYIESLEASYTEQFALQELHAEFVNLTEGRVYYAYSEKNLVTAVFDPMAPTYLCWDFNTAAGKPMCCYVVQKTGPRHYVAIKEFAIYGTHTGEMCAFVKAWLIEMNFRGRLWVTGDYAGTHHRSTAAFSDYEIIRDNFNTFSDYRERIRPTRRIKDRTESLNAALCNAKGERTFHIDRSCSALIQDFEQVSWDDSGLKLSEKVKHLTHPSDSVSYLFYNEHPVDIKEARSAVR